MTKASTTNCCYKPVLTTVNHARISRDPHFCYVTGNVVKIDICLRKEKSLRLPKDAEEAKQAIVNATLLSHPRDDEALSLEVDASEFAADAVFNYT
ncbi:hypothetical protein T07_10224 [Trichinella nelsoni]|uniref:Uncharacterized protein n=1 Tax=Trichinella nelsoni TaxID=6336 RepID=A0A0V0RZT7_9BILA|nr:hypothetical protein T07_10224 [Trichinella nelsoni]